MAEDPLTWSFARGPEWDLGARTRIVGILNVTPDSFSDGGRFLDPERAIARGVEMADEGADAVDIGGESTRPGAAPVTEGEELGRIAPVVAGLRRRFPVERLRISVDTSKAAIAAAALEAGADIVNDVTALAGDPRMASIVARAGASVILMHMRGSPRSMQDDPRYGDLIGEIASELGAARRRAREGGIADDRIVLDPGIGFGKTAEHNLEILARLPALTRIGRPLMIGASRKSFLGKVTGLPVGERLEASLAAGAAAILGGARILRVHDVAASARMARTIDAILRAR
jgi:dihydropteroate synthase